MLFIHKRYKTVSCEARHEKLPFLFSAASQAANPLTFPAVATLTEPTLVFERLFMNSQRYQPKKAV